MRDRIPGFVFMCVVFIASVFLGLWAVDAIVADDGAAAAFGAGWFALMLLLNLEVARRLGVRRNREGHLVEQPPTSESE